MPRFNKWFDELPPAATVQTALQRLWGQRYEAVAHYLTQLQKEKSPSVETVHQLRVWARRATAVVDLFAPTKPEGPWKEIRKLLKKMRRRAGEVRDYDVLWEQFRHSKKVDDDFKATWKRRRQGARKRLAEEARSKKVFKDGPKLLKQAAQEILALRDPTRQQAFRDLARQQLRTAVRKWQKQSAVDLTNPLALHDFRIEGKRLRYALEIAASVMPRKHVAQVYAGLNGLHENLGQICDTRAAIERFELLREELSSDLRKTLSALLRQERRHLKTQQRKFLKNWTPAAREAWASEFCELLK